MPLKVAHKDIQGDYQAVSRRTYRDVPTQDGLHITYLALGLAGEAGEFAGKVSKAHRDDDSVITSERRTQLIDELSDCLWYVSQIATNLGVSLDELAQINADKVLDRLARGKIGGSGDKR